MPTVVPDSELDRREVERERAGWTTSTDGSRTNRSPRWRQRRGSRAGALPVRTGVLLTGGSLGTGVLLTGGPLGAVDGLVALRWLLAS